jgi:hypothetical protein
MKAEFYRPDTEEPAGIARWDGGVISESDDPQVRDALERIFRPSSVVMDDPVARDPAAAGSAVIGPGDLAWFRAAASVRAGEEGLEVRFVTETPGGWDPAGTYRPLEIWTGVREGREPRRGLGTSRA